MIRRVYANQHGIITLDSDMFGSRKRISTGKKSDKRLLKWYEKHFDEEFEKLYEEKFRPIKEDFSEYTLREYGLMVLDLTSDNRRAYIQEKNKKTFKLICDFKMIDNKKFGEFLLTDIRSTHVMKWQNESGLASQTIATLECPPFCRRLIVPSTPHGFLIPKSILPQIHLETNNPNSCAVV